MKSLLQKFKNRRKKIAQGVFGKIYAPNYSCPDFKKRKEYISKMMKDPDHAEHELKQLKLIKKIDPEQKYLASFETSCYASQIKYHTNIIMKNFGRSLDGEGKKEFPKQTGEHATNVFLKQMLKALILLHKNGVYHMDIASRNIVYNKTENRYRLIDFGLSRSEKDIKEAFTKESIEDSYDIDEHFAQVINRGDEGHFYFEQDKKYGLQELMEAANEQDTEAILKMDLKKISNGLIKEHKEHDVYEILMIGMWIDRWSKNTKFMDKYTDVGGPHSKKSAEAIYNEIFKKGGSKKKSKKKKIRKHKGINQKTGRLNKGYKYSGKKFKSGLKQIVKK